MKNIRMSVTMLALAALSALPAHPAVKLTAMQIISTDSNGKIQGVGAHRFKTTQHGGQPCIFLVEGDNLDGTIVNGPDAAHNGLDLTVSAGVHTYTIYAEKYNSYTWSIYSVQLYFDLSQTPQISALAPLNVNSTQFFPPFQPYSEFTEDLAGHPVKTLNTVVYKSGLTEVKLTGFQFSNPPLFNKDRVGPFEAKSDKTLDYIGQITLTVTAPPAIFSGGVVNAASFSARVAPGSLFSVFGSDLAPSMDSAKSLPLDTKLGGVSVTIGGKPAPLVFISAGQINAQVPYEATESDNVPVVVTVNGVSSLAANLSIVPAAPGIFQFGDKHAVAQNDDYTVNNTDSPAKAGSWIVAYLTGLGRPDNSVSSGAAAAGDPLSRPRASVSATVGDRSVEIAFAGLTPGFVGLAQLNLKLPDLPAGNYPLVITANGEKSNAAVISIK